MATIRWCPIFPKWDIYQPLYTHFFQSDIRKTAPPRSAVASAAPAAPRETSGAWAMEKMKKVGKQGEHIEKT